MQITVLQLHKRASYEFKYIQDRYAINSKDRAFALSDGTTQSFNSEFWAEIITKRFVRNPNFDADGLIKDLTAWVQDFKSINFEFSQNPAKASLERTKQMKGATATFIGLQFLNNNEFKLIACGDSNLFLVNSENSVKAYPFDDIDTLDRNNHFINTEQILKGQIESSFFKIETFQYQNGDKVILASDALSRLILRNTAVLKELSEISDFDQLHSFCLKYWESKDLQEDDISAMILSMKQDDTQEIIQPPNDFSFPKEKEEEFIPHSLLQSANTKLSAMQVNEIMDQFNGVAHDFQQVKNKLWLHGVLLITLVGLFAVNTLIFFLLMSNQDKKSLKPDNAAIQQYETKINSLTSEIRSLKEKIANPEKQGEEIKEVEQQEKPKPITQEEAMRRQNELIKAGHVIKADGIWGKQSEKLWSAYTKKNK